MNMQQCPNGHFFDASKSASCPYCSPATDSHTIPLDQGTAGFGAASPGGSTIWGQQNAVPGGVGATTPIAAQPQNQAGGTIGRTMPAGFMPDDRHTMAVMHKKSGINPVVGWLVCVEGPDKGKDYRLRSGNNILGRSDRMDVCVQGDDTISREDAAYIVYDPHSKKTFVGAGKGQNLVYVNDELLLPNQNHECKAYDRMLVGETTLLFMPLCGEAFDWA